MGAFGLGEEWFWEDDVGIEDLDADEALVLPVERDQRVDAGGRLGTSRGVARRFAVRAAISGVGLARDDLAADLARWELGRVHVRVGDAGIDRSLHRR